MAGKLPIDRARARTEPAQPYDDNRQTFTEDRAALERDRQLSELPAHQRDASGSETEDATEERANA
jgi:hypothetical protein